MLENYNQDYVNDVPELSNVHDSRNDYYHRKRQIYTSIKRVPGIKTAYNSGDEENLDKSMS